MNDKVKDKEKAPGAAVARQPEQDDALVAELITGAKTPQERAQAYDIAGSVQQLRLIRRMASLVAATTWGAALSQEGRVAFGRYCLEVGADPLRHVDLLGGQPFFNSDYYRDLIAANPAFVRDEPPVWLHDDPRLKQDTNDKDLPQDVRDGAQKERLYRRSQRIDRNIPEETPSCCLLRLHYKDRGPFEGLGMVHAGKVTNSRDPAKRQNDRDPIGLDNPRATAEARAWREAGEKAEPIWFRNHPRIKELGARLTELHDAGALREGPAAPELPPAPVVVEEAGVVDLGRVESVTVESGEPQVGQPEEAERTENHNPSAMCTIEGPHRHSECGFYRKGGIT
jgi:hypothetical protein